MPTRQPGGRGRGRGEVTTTAPPSTAPPSTAPPFLSGLKKGAQKIMSPLQETGSAGAQAPPAPPPAAPPGVATAEPSLTGSDLLEKLKYEHESIQSGFETGFSEYMASIEEPALSEKTHDEHRETYAVEKFYFIRNKALEAMRAFEEKENEAGTTSQLRTGSAGETGSAAHAADLVSPTGEQAAAGSAGSAGAEGALALTGSAGAAQPRKSVGECRAEPKVEFPPSDEETEVEQLVLKKDGSQMKCHKCHVLLTSRNRGSVWLNGDYENGRCSKCQRVMNIQNKLKAIGGESVDFFVAKSQENKLAWFEENDTAGLLAKDLKTKLDASYEEEKSKSLSEGWGHDSDWLTPGAIQMLVDSKKMAEDEAAAVLQKANRFTDDMGLERYEIKKYKSSFHETENLEQSWKRGAAQQGANKAAKKAKAKANAKSKAPAEPESAWTNAKEKQVDNMLQKLGNVQNNLETAERWATEEQKLAFPEPYKQLALTIKEVEKKVTDIQTLFDENQVAGWDLQKVVAEAIAKNAKTTCNTWAKLTAFRTG